MALGGIVATGSEGDVAWLSPACGQAGASTCTRRRLCLAPAEAGNVDTAGAEFLPEGVVVVNWSPTWSSGGAAS
jgi:hypothetical protein